MKTTATRQPLAMIADDAIEQLRYDREQANWLAALMRAIGTDLKTGAHGAAALAGLGQYLADDLTNYIDRQVAHLQDALNTAEGEK